MNKVIEADFLPRETNAGFSWPNSIGGSGMKEMRRILIIDDDADTTHAAGETPPPAPQPRSLCYAFLSRRREPAATLR